VMKAYRHFRIAMGALIVASLAIVCVAEASELLVAKSPYERAGPPPQPVFTADDKDMYYGHL